MNLREAIIRKIDELLLEGEKVYILSCPTLGFEIGEIRASHPIAPGTPIPVRVLGASMPLDAQDATTIYDYLESCYYEHLKRVANKERGAALKYLGIS